MIRRAAVEGGGFLLPDGDGGRKGAHDLVRLASGCPPSPLAREAKIGFDNPARNQHKVETSSTAHRPCSLRFIVVFSSITFLLCFLPVTLITYYLAGNRLRNLVLLLTSLLFYTWGEGGYVLIMLLSIALNYVVGRQLDRIEGKQARTAVLAGGIGLNLVLLGYFKYGNWLAEIVAGLVPGLQPKDILADPIHLPIGISFFTFQALSYIIDVYRHDTKAQPNPLHLGLYIASFPQLIAGPIVRYSQVAAQIRHRLHDFSTFASGVERFVLGLSKKVLIANPLSAMADLIFAQQYAHLPVEVAWLGIICYALQIYFDFSGYSDMAVGLGRMFGFQFPENFNYPYVSRSIQEFWRRWHITLSTWFRDYLYIPLGGNQRSAGKTYRNLVVVFLLCGLWHGASWNFVVWGAMHGAFLALERLALAKWLQSVPRFFCHVYTLLVVLVAWVFFRVEHLPDALAYLQTMFFLAEGADPAVRVSVYLQMDGVFLCALALGLLFSTPWFVSLKTWLADRQSGAAPSRFRGLARSTMQSLLLFSLLSLCLSFLAVNSYNPFIYFRF